MSEKVHEAIKEIDEFKKKIYERSSNMSSTNKTTNYELSQFVETDKPGWLTDYNSDMRIIDSNLKSVSDVASSASGSLSALTDRVTAAEGAITTNANDIDALEARADVLEAQAQSMSGTIANIQTEQITQNAGIEAATELGYNLARPYDSASTYAVGDYVLFQNTLYKCITAVPVGEAFVPAKWLAIKATDEISAGGYTLPIASANTLGGVKVGSGLSIDALTGVLSASGSGGNIEYELLTSDDVTINVLSASYVLDTNYYSGTYSQSQGTIAHPTVSLADNYLNLLITVDNDLKILVAHFKATCDAIQLASKQRISCSFHFAPILSDKIPIPTIKAHCYAENEIALWRLTYDTTSPTQPWFLSFSEFNYRTSSLSVSQRENIGPFILIYR